MSTKNDIQQGLADRLKTITTANGYTTNVAKVLHSDIPMGLDLEQYNLPAVLVIAGNDVPVMKTQCYFGFWEFELQLWHNEVTDAVMDQYVRDVAKGIWANSPTAKRNDGFRGPSPGGIHESVYNVLPLEIEPDLNMIEANRCYMFHIQLQFETKLYNL